MIEIILIMTLYANNETKQKTRDLLKRPSEWIRLVKRLIYDRKTNDQEYKDPKSHFAFPY